MCGRDEKGTKGEGGGEEGGEGASRMGIPCVQERCCITTMYPVGHTGVSYRPTACVCYLPALPPTAEILQRLSRAESWPRYLSRRWMRGRIFPWVTLGMLGNRGGLLLRDSAILRDIIWHSLPVNVSLMFHIVPFAKISRGYVDDSDKRVAFKNGRILLSMLINLNHSQRSIVFVLETECTLLGNSLKLMDILERLASNIH